MFDLNRELKKFRKDHVALTSEIRKKLREHRDVNIERIKDGLTKLEHPLPSNFVNQGGFIMGTTVQQADNDYDIDIGVKFDQESLPEDPYQSRKRIESALLENRASFSKPPKIRTNAITVWYAEGHHVDFAVYRENVASGIVEHASTEWEERAPEAITDWFKQNVDSLSPKKNNGANIEDKQLKRVVQFIKMFAGSRSSWNLPGGLILTVLATECYVSNQNRDDLALINTLKSISSRLSMNKHVANPTNQSFLLTDKDQHINEVDQLKEKIDFGLKNLEILESLDCEKLDAVKAWGKFFAYDYWENLETIIEDAQKEGAEINKARNASGLYVTQRGALKTKKTTSDDREVRKHSFYGD